MIVRPGVRPKLGLTKFESVLEAANGVPATNLMQALRSHAFREEVARVASSYSLISSSLGVYPGQLRRDIPREIKEGKEIADAYGFPDGRKVVLDGASITQEVAEKAASVEGRPFLYFDYVDKNNVRLTPRGNMIIYADPASAHVVGSLPWENSPKRTDSLNSIFDLSVRQFVTVYGNPTANRVGSVSIDISAYPRGAADIINLSSLMGSYGGTIVKSQSAEPRAILITEENQGILVSFPDGTEYAARAPQGTSMKVVNLVNQPDS